MKEEWDYQKIRQDCQNAIEIANDLGPDEALSYLIGENLSVLFLQLKKARGRVKFLYTESEREAVETLAEKDRAFKTGYMMAVENDYKEDLQEIDHLERLLSDFVQEIKEVFDDRDIFNYLESYPRLGKRTDEDLLADLKPEDAMDGMKTKDVMEEVEDIFLTEEILGLFRNPRLAR